MSKLLRSILDMSKCPKNPVVTIYDRDDIKVCSTSNEIEFDYIRWQIAENKIEGCYIIFNDNKYPIESNGRINSWPKGLFDVNTGLLVKIIKSDFEPKKKKSKLIDSDACPSNEHVEIYDNEDNLIVRTNSDLEFNWVRAEIKEKNLKGCYLIFRGKKIEINENGDLVEYPHGLFEYNGEQLCRML